MRYLVSLFALLLAATASVAFALPGTFVIRQIFSNADGSIQFVVVNDRGTNDCDAGENLWTGQTLTSSGPAPERTFVFLHDLPTCKTSGRNMLIASEGFAALNLVTPDFIIPNDFIQKPSGVLDLAGSSNLAYTALPNDGIHAIDRSGAPIQNVATNLAGNSASVPLLASTPNYQGLWWKAPGGSEDGWGINFAHQGNVIFGTWFTYDTTGKGWWLTLINDTNPSAGVFTAKLYATTGPPFNTVPFVKTGGPPPPIGSATLNFTDANNASFHYDVNLPTGTVSQTNAITRQPLGAGAFATCTAGANLATASNYQDIWWAGTSATPGTESGWGINFAHQGDTIFVSWFTYDLDGTPLWLVATAPKTGPGIYEGDLYRPSGPRFDAYDKSQFKANPPVGMMKLTFADGNNAAFNYTVQVAGMTTPVTQTKPITRQLFSAAGTTCQ